MNECVVTQFLLRHGVDDLRIHIIWAESTRVFIVTVFLCMFCCLCIFFVLLRRSKQQQ